MIRHGQTRVKSRSMKTLMKQTLAIICKRRQCTKKSWIGGLLKLEIEERENEWRRNMRGTQLWHARERLLAGHMKYSTQFVGTNRTGLNTALKH